MSLRAGGKNHMLVAGMFAVQMFLAYMLMVRKASSTIIYGHYIVLID